MFEFIDANRASFKVAQVCRLLGVSRSGYYCWQSRPPSKRATSDEVMTRKILLVHEASRSTHGYRRVTAELNDTTAHHVGPKRVAPLMTRANIQGVTRRKFCRTTGVTIKPGRLLTF